MASELEAESSEIKDLIQLLTREDYLINQHRESFKLYSSLLVHDNVALFSSLAEVLEHNVTIACLQE